MRGPTFWERILDRIYLFKQLFCNHKFEELDVRDCVEEDWKWVSHAINCEKCGKLYHIDIALTMTGEEWEAFNN